MGLQQAKAPRSRNLLEKLKVTQFVKKTPLDDAGSFLGCSAV
jgi:hypothetical protein